MKGVTVSVRASSAPRLSTVCVAALVLAAFAIFSPGARGETATLGGSPLTVFVSSAGNLQVAHTGTSSYSFYSPSEMEGDGGFFVGFPGDIPSQNIEAGSFFGPPLRAGPENYAYEQVSFGAVSGGEGGVPYTQTLTNAVNDPEDESKVLTVAQTVTYEPGAGAFRTKWTLKNVSGTTLSFRASAAADLYLEGSDVGSGFFEAGPPRFIGGLSEAANRGGGLEEVASSPWSAYQEGGYYSDIWEAVSHPEGPGFDNTFLTELLDNGTGVQWEIAGLANGASKTLELVWNLGLPGVSVSPESATVPRGSQHSVTVSGTDRNGNAFDGVPLNYTIDGANPQSGTVTMSGGQAVVTWTGDNVGHDQLTAYPDENGDGARQVNEPEVSATADWYQQPPTTRITSGPRGKTFRRYAKFGFTSNEPEVSFECKLTGKRVSRRAKSWAPCDSPKRYSRLRPGGRIFWVRALKGGTTGRAAKRGWRVVKRKGPKPLVVPATRRKAIFRVVCPLRRACRAKVRISAGKRTLARGRYAVRAHSSHRVRIGLTRAGRRLLAAKRRVGAKLTIRDIRTRKHESLRIILKRRR